MENRSPGAPRGRPVATSPAQIELTAFSLFAERGFAGTTLDDIARSLGVGRRTLFRYYQSKNDIPWGQFDQTVDGFRKLLAATEPNADLAEAVHSAVVAFNDFPSDARPSHRERMRLILITPELRAHSMLKYAEWRAVIAECVATRVGESPHALFPEVVGQVSLALALSAYDTWLADESLILTVCVADAMKALRRYVDAE